MGNRLIQAPALARRGSHFSGRVIPVWWCRLQSTNEQPPAGPLRSLLRDRQVQERVATAELIRDYPDCPERTTEAERHVRQVMLAFTMGEITDQERAKIIEILAFAVPPLPEYLATPDPPPWIAEKP